MAVAALMGLTAVAPVVADDTHRHVGESHGAQEFHYTLWKCLFGLESIFMSLVSMIGPFHTVII